MNAALTAVRALGLEPGACLGQGMEGIVFALDDDRVAKVWHLPSRRRVEAARLVLDEVADAGLPFATPRILQVLDSRGTTVTVERRLPGSALPRPVDPDGEPTLVRPSTAEALVEVLGALAAVTPTAPMAALPVLPGEPAFDVGRSFPVQLAEVVERRVALARPTWRARLPEVDRLLSATRAALTALAPVPDALLHGDLVPANVHVAGGVVGSGVVALLDLGFLTTVGDPAFDAAVTASVYDMYGPRGRASERAIDAVVLDRSGADPHRLAVYRAAYCLATGTVYSPAGDDGHFAWCAARLERADVRAALEV